MVEITQLTSSLFGCLILFAIGSGLIALCGTQMAKLADQLADRTGIGEALTGTIFLGLITALPGIVASVNTAHSGVAGLTISNALGGIAIQTVFLAIADIFYRKVNLEHASASITNIVQTAFLLFLISLITMALVGPDLLLGRMSFFSYALFLSAGVAITIAHHSKLLPMWKPHRTRETILDKPKEQSQKKNLAHLLLRFFFNAAIVLISGYGVSEAAQGMVQLTDISQTLVGALFLAFSTSLPELFTTVAAVRMGALTLAVGDIVGGNFFDSLFVAIGDIFYAEGSIYQGNGVTDREAFLSALCLILNLTLLIGLLIRQKKGPGNIGIESVLMILFYLMGIGGVYFFMS